MVVKSEKQLIEQLTLPSKRKCQEELGIQDSAKFLTCITHISNLSTEKLKKHC